MLSVYRLLTNIVFIRLVSPSSGDLHQAEELGAPPQVFIRLVSPSSGDWLHSVTSTEVGFHSISVPIEWGPLHSKPLPSKKSRGSFRGSRKLTAEMEFSILIKHLKALYSKRPRFKTLESLFQLF